MCPLKNNTYKHMKFAVIKSNHISLEGHDRQWELISIVTSIKNAKTELAQQSICFVEGFDKWIVRNNRMWHIDKKTYLYTNNQNSFSYDSRIYTFVSENEVDLFFDGRFHGYIPQFIIDEFKLKKE